ncbi:hypothetical protein V1514DRAFT_345379 [Lipomyces japonicus]|uniref:uncharacterized protein n=1 Tax=Lipomyces japonicus TaxID=56871 RepID=UPI0034CDA592
MTSYSSNVFQSGLFTGKVAFVTGGAGAICRRQVEALVSLGANAAILGRSKSKTEHAAAEIARLRPGARVLGLIVDVRDHVGMQQAATTTVAELGRIDFVICGAAGNFLADVRHLSANAFKTVIDIDLLGSFNTVKAAQEQLIRHAHEGSSVIFVSATLHYHGVPFQAHVAAAKAGIDALSNALAVELGPYGVRSNCIAPGPIDETEGIARLLPAKERQQAIKHVPLGRFGTKNDIADATVFLLSEAASYVNGSILVVDGGAWQISQSHLPYPDAILQGLTFDRKQKKDAKL